jgi:hypothetical protein
MTREEEQIIINKLRELERKIEKMKNNTAPTIPIYDISATSAAGTPLS